MSNSSKIDFRKLRWLSRFVQIYAGTMSAVGRVQLYAMTGTVGPVYASKRLFTRLDFQSDKGLESARSRDNPGRKGPPE
jgi:hypothetical protein